MSSKVETSQGVVVGTESDGVTAFKGIRYAAPPVGDLRFARPIPPPSWSGEQDCGSYGAISLQHLDPALSLIPGGEWCLYAPGTVQSEDCLNLNVWTPDSTASLPVMFWMHGGAWTAGSGTGLWYDGTAFAKNHGVVVVTINYRLGALGYLSVEDPRAGHGLTANNGLLDQVAALQWVRENIAAFGGDPTNLCIFGESAGAMSVAALLGTPRAHGLFSKAIVQSGHHDIVRTIEQSDDVTERYLEKLGIPRDGAIARMRELAVEDLMAAQTAVGAEALLPFTMVVDGDVLPVHPISEIALGSAAAVPLIIGTNTDENRLFEVLGQRAGIPSGSFSDRMNAFFLVDRTSAVERVALIEELLCTYSSDAFDDDERYREMSNDRMWRAPAEEFAQAYQNAGGTVFSYEFNFASPVLDGAFHSCHSMEIPFAFGNLNQRGVNEFIGDEISDDSVAGRLATQMNAAWAQFSKSGNPTNQVLVWNERTSSDREQMYFGTDTAMRADPHAAKNTWWLQHLDVTIPRLGV